MSLKEMKKMSDDHSQSEFENLVRSREDLQYVAGMIDGEGSIMLLRNVQPHGAAYIRPRITITNKSRKVLQRCRRILRAGRIERAHSKTDVLRLAIERRTDIARSLRALLPFIKLKRTQALVMMAFLRSDREAGHEFVLARRMRQLNGSE